MASGSVTVTMNPAFTSATSFICTVSGQDNATISSDYRFQVTYNSGCSITITSTATAAQTIGFICEGN